LLLIILNLKRGKPRNEVHYLKLYYKTNFIQKYSLLSITYAVSEVAYTSILYLSKPISFKI